MRVLLVSFYGLPDQTTSAAQFAQMAARLLVRGGHETKMVCAGPERRSMIHPDGYEILCVPTQRGKYRTERRFAPWHSTQDTENVAAREIDSWAPDVVFMGAWKHLRAFALHAASRGIPVLQHVHDYSLVCLRQWLLNHHGNRCIGPGHEKCRSCVAASFSWKRRLLARASRFVPSMVWTEGFRREFDYDRGFREAWAALEDYLSAVSVFLAQTPRVAEVLSRCGLDPGRVRFLPQCIGNARLERFRLSGNDRSVSTVKIGFVGRWTTEKGAELLWQSFWRARVEGSCELWLISRGLTPSRLEQIPEGANAQGKKVKTFGEVSGVEVSHLLAQVDVCVVPSICEELASRVVLEAHAQGTPVIASDSVGNAYLIEHNVNGAVFPSGDENSLIRLIEGVSMDATLPAKWGDQIQRPITEQEWFELFLGVLEASRKSESAEKGVPICRSCRGSHRTEVFG